MKLTDIRIHLLDQKYGKLRAFASITLDGELVIHDLRIIAGAQGVFVGMPSRKTPQGDYQDIIIPISTPLRDLLQTQILRAYEDELARPENRGSV